MVIEDMVVTPGDIVSVQPSCQCAITYQTIVFIVLLISALGRPRVAIATIVV
jgi:hypothetical protein